MSNMDMFVQRFGSSPEWTSAIRLHNQCFLVGDFNQTLCVPANGDGHYSKNAVFRSAELFSTVCKIAAKNDEVLCVCGTL
jgi:hypothetical protein